MAKRQKKEKKYVFRTTITAIGYDEALKKLVNNKGDKIEWLIRDNQKEIKRG